MENFFTRYKNPLVLMLVLVIQVIALATQVKRPDPRQPASAGSGGGTRLIRVWTVTAITPFEEALVATGHFFRNTWHNYLDLHDVRRQNRELQQEIDRLRMEQVRLRNGADQYRRLQSLLDFKERFAGPTVAAQVIGSSGSEQSHVIYIDKGSRAGIRQDMAVITPDGIVGKVHDVYPFSSQVLMINDHEGGAGVILESSRLQGILHGKETGEIRINDIMSDEKVDVGERVITSGGDRVYPKGLPVGTVTAVGPDPDAGPFLLITIKPAANLDRLEEVLVITKMAEEAPLPSPGEIAHRPTESAGDREPAALNQPGENKPEENAAGTASNKPPATLSGTSLTPASNEHLAAPSATPHMHASGNPLAPGTGTSSATSTSGKPRTPASGKPLATPVSKPLAPAATATPRPQTASADKPPSLEQNPGKQNPGTQNQSQSPVQEQRQDQTQNPGQNSQLKPGQKPAPKQKPPVAKESKPKESKPAAAPQPQPQTPDTTEKPPR